MAELDQGSQTGRPWPRGDNTPVITSVVYSASYQPTLGSPLVSIFGTNLATTTAAAQSVPLPLNLGGTSVKVGGIAAPLLFVSPTLVNLQLPAGGAYIVTTFAGNSTPYDPSTLPRVLGEREVFSPQTAEAAAKGCA